MTKQLISDEDIIKRINYEGFPFQRAVFETIVFARSNGPNGEGLQFKADEEVPMGVSNHPDPTQSNAIDILAWQRTADTVLYMTIECKRPDPNRKIWVFINHHESAKLRATRHIPIWYIYNPKEGYYEMKYGTNSLVNLSDSYFHSSYPLEIISQDKGSSSGKNIVVMSAALQVSVGTIGHLENYTLAMKNIPKVVFTNAAFLPMIVTTAELYSCKCKDLEQTINNGEITAADINPEKWVLYYYPLPQFLFRKTNNPESYEDYFSNKLPIMIVNSKYLIEFLNEISIR